MATTSTKSAEATAEPEAKSPTASPDLAATETEEVEETVEAEPLPEKIKVKNIWVREISLASGVVKAGETGEASKAEFENYAGIYVEKA